MKVGFTGTRDGMTPEQCASLHRILSELPTLNEFHHGDCRGADDEAADMVHEMRQYAEDNETWAIVRHPPVYEKFRAFNRKHDQDREPKSFYDRNRDIVDETDTLIACPKEMTEQPNGETWMTVRYARSKAKPVYVVYPDGSMEGPKS